MDKDTLFIKTKDSETISLLKESGFTLLSFNNNIATFINDGKINFDLLGKKVNFSNRLEV
jgi:hypothetical protein